MSYKDSSRSWCDVCGGMEYLPLDIIMNRKPVCTCGAGSMQDMQAMHKISCDAVPCPFCQLRDTAVFQEV